MTMNLQNTNSSDTATADREISTTRIFDAESELVFAMWTNPVHIAKWWGPTGFSVTIHEMDVRVGGTLRMTMHGPDGRDYPNRYIYDEVKRPERLVYSHNPGEGDEPVRFQATVTFEDLGGKTKLSVRMVFDTAETRNMVATKYGAVEGLHQTLGRLAEQLALHIKQ